MSNIHLKKIGRTLVSLLAIPSKPSTERELESRRSLRARGVASQLSYGSISLQEGRFLTKDDEENERRMIKKSSK